MILLPNSTSPRSCEWLSLSSAEHAGLSEEIHYTGRQCFAPDVKESCSSGSSLTSLAHAGLLVCLLGIPFVLFVAMTKFRFLIL